MRSWWPPWHSQLLRRLLGPPAAAATLWFGWPTWNRWLFDMGMAIKPSSAAEPFGAYRADYVIPGAVGILVAVFVGGALFHAGSAWLRWLAEGHKQDTRRVLHTGRAEQHAGMISVAATPADQGALSAPKNDIV